MIDDLIETLEGLITASSMGVVIICDGEKHELDEIQRILQQIKELKLESMKLVNAQAEDEGLWFNHKYITENYLQQALRKLHSVVEKDFNKLNKIIGDK